MSKKKSKVKKWIIFSIVALAVIILAAAFFMRPRRGAYETAVAGTGDITTYSSFSGNVDTKSRQNVTSEKAMQISTINVKEGDTVSEGDILLKTSMGEEIKAKISGEVVNLSVQENDQVMAGVKLMEIVDYNNLEVNVKVDEYDVAAVTAGKEATVNIPAIDKDIKGTISSISREGQVTNGITYFPATIDLAKDDALKIGMTAEVKLLSAQVTGVVTLPMKAIQFDSDNKPYVLKETGTGRRAQATRVDITTGINDGTTVEIKSGVASGETILYTTASTSNAGIIGGPRVRAGGNNSSSNAGTTKGGIGG